MKDWNRDQVARQFFDIMNKRRFPISRADLYLQGDVASARLTDAEYDKRALDNMWVWYVEMGWHEGYLRLADETVGKGYKP